MPSDEQLLSPGSPPFKIRHFVSTIRGQDFSRCWPFSHRILERCLLLGMKVELPPLDAPSIGNNLGNYNNTAEVTIKCSTKAESCGFSNVSDYRESATMKLADLSNIRADSKHGEICGTEAVSLAENIASFTNKSCPSVFRSCDNAAAVKLSTESSWDGNALSLSEGDLSISSSLMMLEAKAELLDYVGVNLTRQSGSLHVTTADMALNDEPSYGGLFQVAKEEGVAAAQKNQQPEQHITSTGLPDQRVLFEIQPSTPGNKVLAERNPKADHKPVVQVTESEGCTHKTEKSQQSVDLGLLRSNSDSSMPQVCPICLKFSSSSNTALNAHIDHCLVVEKSNIRPSKKRFKIRKVRSMVDIYATAPTRTLEDLERSSQG
ncbi:hypothetical protein L7F22_017242 [Adiantum nelumboides]|nr:hypothetical protein [Adiantum nelumboides]